MNATIELPPTLDKPHRPTAHDFVCTFDPVLWFVPGFGYAFMEAVERETDSPYTSLYRFKHKNYPMIVYRRFSDVRVSHIVERDDA